MAERDRNRLRAVYLRGGYRGWKVTFFRDNGPHSYKYASASKNRVVVAVRRAVKAGCEAVLNPHGWCVKVRP
jgi:hypothetical protein